MNTTVAQLTARSLLGRRRAALLMALPVILLMLCVVARSLAGSDEALTVSLLGGFALGTLVPLVGLIVGTGAIGPEIDDGSIVYLLSKPQNRFAIVNTKFLVAVAIVTLAAAVPTLLAGVILSGTWGGVALAYGVGAAVAGIAYCSLFLLLGVVTRNAVVIGLIYAIIWESLIGGFVPGAQALSIQQWALAITEAMLGTSAEVLGIASSVGLGTAATLLLVVIAGGIAVAGHRLRSLRLSTDE